jgi:hypothetical protein
MTTETYKGYTLKTQVYRDGSQDTMIFDKDDNPVGGCASHLDKLTSIEKAKRKIDLKQLKEPKIQTRLSLVGLLSPPEVVKNQKNMVTLTRTGNGLQIILTDKAALQDIFDRCEKQNRPVTAFEILDFPSGYIGNGWDDITGKAGLTDSPIIAYNIGYDDDGEPEIYSDSEVYWFPDYMIVDPFDKLLKEGGVFFNLAEK